MKNSKQSFPYVDYKNQTTKFGKNKFPHVALSKQKNMYGAQGHRIVRVAMVQEGYRFNTAQITLEKPDGSTYTNMVTLSNPSAEAICLRKNENGKVEMVLLLQVRTPYVANCKLEEETKQFARFFIEEPAGLLEEDESFEEAAIREVEEETGYKVEKITALMHPVICRHVSYSDESSKVFVAKLTEKRERHLDMNEEINVVHYLLEDVEKELDLYLEGKVQCFFGFDLPEMTIMSLLYFFKKWNRGDFKDFLGL